MANQHNSQPQSPFILKILRRLPSWAMNYALLARWDKPIGTWLLLLPCWWGILIAHLAAPPQAEIALSDTLRLVLYFAIGAVVMRGAGCTWNDILDRKADAKVKRTQNRPLPSGRITILQACLFMTAQSLCGLIILMQLPRIAIIVGLLSLFLVALYPLCKRVTHWPQAWLGLTFNWGLIVGYLSIPQIDSQINSIAHASLLIIYVASVFWTLGYDTIYALQDKHDDLKIGVKSLAILLGNRCAYGIAGFYTLCHALMASAAYLLKVNPLFWLFWALAGTHLCWQVWRLHNAKTKNSAPYAQIFKSNRDYGLLMVLAFLSANLL